MSRLAISTAQNVNLDYKLIGLGERLVAFLIDGLLLITYITIMEKLVEVSTFFETEGWTRRGLMALTILPAMFYSVTCHILFDGKTIGKMIMKIKVVRLDGSPTQWYNLMVRWMLRIIDIWMFFASIGTMSILFSEKKQRVGDSAAGTVVISTKNKERISSTILEDLDEDYQPVFTNVTVLKDKDVRIIKETFNIAKKTNDYKTLILLRRKVSNLIQAESDLFDMQFIDTVLKDYNYYTQNM